MTRYYYARLTAHDTNRIISYLGSLKTEYERNEDYEETDLLNELIYSLKGKLRIQDRLAGERASLSRPKAKSKKADDGEQRKWKKKP